MGRELTSSLEVGSVPGLDLAMVSSLDISFALGLTLVAAGLLLVSILSSLVSARVGAPLLLVFLLIGMLAGEDGPGGIPFSDFEGAFVLGSLALALILFDSGLNTRLAAVRLAVAPSMALATLGVVLTAVAVGLAAMWAFDLPLLHGLLFGAIVSSTDAAAVFFLLNVTGLNLKERVRATLEIESGSNDPMAVFLTVALIELIRAGQGLDWSLATLFLGKMGLGLLLGLAGGWLLAAIVNRVNLASGLYPLVSLSGALMVFAGGELSDGSGFLAVYVAGLMVGNRRLRSMQNIRRFHDGLTWLGQMMMFLLLGLLVTPHRLADVAVPALAVAAVLILLARPAVVALLLLPFGFSWRETIFVGWVGLRGAVSILLAVLPVVAGLPDGYVLFNAVFVVVLASLAVQGWTIRLAARKLGLAVPGGLVVHRTELDLPGQQELELVAYRVDQGAPAANRLQLPDWARLMLVMREGRMLPAAQTIHALMPGDHAYVLAPPSKAPLLDRVFARPAERDLAQLDYFGEFMVPAATPVRDLIAAYGGKATPDLLDRTLAMVFDKAYAHHPVVGDRLRLGEIELVAVDLDDGGMVAQVGLKLMPEEPRFLDLSPRDMVRRLFKDGR